MPTKTREPWLTLKQCQDQTNVPIWRLRRLAHAGRIPFSKPFGPRARMLVRASDVLRVIEENVTPTHSGS